MFQVVNINCKKELAVSGCICDSVIKSMVVMVSGKGSRGWGLVGVWDARTHAHTRTHAYTHTFSFKQMLFLHSSCAGWKSPIMG